MHTKSTITSIKALAKECSGIRERGYATDESEYAPDLRCVAAPIRLGTDIVGSIGISAPASRFTKSLYTNYGAKVCDVAARIGESLDHENSKH
jgi:IclR family acetate operon transcriptional repressor